MPIRVFALLFVSFFVAGISGCGNGGGVDPTSSATQSSFNFGNDLVGVSLTRTVLQVTNTGQHTRKLNPVISGDPAFSLIADQSCPARLAPQASCSFLVNYAPTTPSAPATQTATLTLNSSPSLPGEPASVSLSGTSAVLPPGQVSPTQNPQVALYTITLPFAGSVKINFGRDTTYGSQTSTQTAAAGQQVSILVADMLANTQYHMQAAVDLGGGLQAVDTDHTFTTGTLPPSLHLPNLTVSTTPGALPQPGIELLEVNYGYGVATDLAGNVIWTTTVPGFLYGVNAVEGMRLLPNGHFAMVVTALPSTLSATAPASNALNDVREIDLAGNIIRQLKMADLNAQLAAMGDNLNLITFHHDIAVLPNGHWLVLANLVKQYTDLPGYPGVTNVAGDAIIDLDTNLHPVWVWNTFDHLDVNRHPWNFPDWTHSNAVIYSPDDGAILLSMRHQNWVIKIDYGNGSGSGNVLWRLGEGGDYTLQNGVDPTDWFYAQHYPSFFSKNTSGVFQLGVMDNGDDRQFPAGVTCGSSGAPPCLYTTIPIFQIDESARTATLVHHQILSAYSFFGGNTELLANGNTEYDLAGEGLKSDIYEVTTADNPQTVWNLHSDFQLYRGRRISSLYPPTQ